MTRNTVQQSIVYKQLQELANHPNADEVYRAVNAQHPSISKATVYRVLNKLANNGEILKISSHDGAAYFDHQTHTHCHAKCDSCGRIVDINFNLEDLDLIHAAQAMQDDFNICGYNIQFNGICASCQSEEKDAS